MELSVGEMLCEACKLLELAKGGAEGGGPDSTQTLLLRLKRDEHKQVRSGQFDSVTVRAAGRRLSDADSSQ